MKLIIVSVIIFSLLFSFVIADVPEPPPVPDFGDSSSGSGSGGSSSGNDNSAPPFTLPIFNFGDSDFEDNNSDPGIPSPPSFNDITGEEPKEPNLECPAKTSGWTIFLLILDILLIAIIVFLIIYFMKKHEKSVVNTEEKKGFSDDIIYDGLGPIRDYINDCRAKGFDDDKIKVELLKKGYDVETIKKLF